MSTLLKSPAGRREEEPVKSADVLTRKEDTEDQRILQEEKGKGGNELDNEDDAQSSSLVSLGATADATMSSAENHTVTTIAATEFETIDGGSSSAAAKETMATSAAVGMEVVDENGGSAASSGHDSPALSSSSSTSDERVKGHSQIQGQQLASLLGYGETNDNDLVLDLGDVNPAAESDDDVVLEEDSATNSDHRQHLFDDDIVVYQPSLLEESGSPTRPIHRRHLPPELDGTTDESSTNTTTEEEDHHQEVGSNHHLPILFTTRQVEQDEGDDDADHDLFGYDDDNNDPANHPDAAVAAVPELKHSEADWEEIEEVERLARTFELRQTHAESPLAKAARKANQVNNLLFMSTSGDADTTAESDYEAATAAVPQQMYQARRLISRRELRAIREQEFHDFMVKVFMRSAIGIVGIVAVGVILLSALNGGTG